MKNLRLNFTPTKEWNPMVLDVETQYLSTEVEGGWNSIDKMKVSVAVTWDTKVGIRVWFEEDVAKLLQESTHYDPVVTFNGEGFDFTVLSAYGDVSHLYRTSKDILTAIKGAVGHRVHLDSVVKATLGVEGKTGTGLDAVAWWRSGEPELRQKVVDYCISDVELTRDVYLYARDKGHLFFFDKTGEKQRTNISL